VITSFERLLAAIDELEDPAWCEGVARIAGPLTIESDGDTCTSDRGLVPWLLERSQDAPFGDGKATRLDTAVRATKRLRSRGTTVITGLDVMAIVGDVERAFASSRTITASLLDVLVYPNDGKFVRHKDTPRTADQLGTLIVEVPVVHAGGALKLSDGRKDRVIDWSGPVRDPKALRWVALFGDVDHEIAAVTSGARVTLVYTLTATRVSRTAPALHAVADAMIALVADAAALPGGGELLIPCSRLIVAPVDTAQPLGLDVLRGLDRSLADALAGCGVRVGVRECLIATEADDKAFPELGYDAVRLARTIPANLATEIGMTFADEADGEYLEGEDATVACLGEYVLGPIPEESWLVRKSARATIIYNGMFSGSGYFGNECGDAYVYAIAALELVLDPYTQRIS
jgi:hypothetical protein